MPFPDLVTALFAQGCIRDSGGKLCPRCRTPCSLFQRAPLSGLNQNASLSQLVLFVPFFELGLGRSNGYRPPPYGRRHCLVCGGTVQRNFGIICANFGLRQNKGVICQGACHAKCYRQLPEDRFPVLKMKDSDDALIDESDPGFEDRDRF